MSNLPNFNCKVISVDDTHCFIYGGVVPRKQRSKGPLSNAIDCFMLDTDTLALTRIKTNMKQSKILYAMLISES